RGRLAKPQPAVEPVVAEETAVQAVREVRSDKPQVSAASNYHGGSTAPPGGRRADQVPGGEQDQQQRPGETQVRPGPVEAPVRAAAPAADQQQVARTLRAALGGGVEDSGGEQAEHERRPGGTER